MQQNNVFPFVAVTGQDSLKKALMLNVINPAIGGVLISGEKGTAKSTLVRGLASVLKDMEVVDLPLNITEDRLIGSIDIEQAIKGGLRRLDPGILERAHGNILYVDEVNLLGDAIVNCLLNVCALGENRVEREGMSSVHPSVFVLAGTMNPEEGELRPQFLDRFGLYVECRGAEVLQERTEIIRRRLEYEADESAFIALWQQETEALTLRLEQSKALLPEVQLSGEAMSGIAEAVQVNNCAGNRGEVVLAETARALAALALRREVLPEDLVEAIRLALPHRARAIQPREQSCGPQEERESDQKPSAPQPKEPEAEDNPSTEEEREQTDNPQQTPENPSEGPQEGSAERAPEDGNGESSGNGEEKVDAPEGVFSIKPLDIQIQDRKKREGSGKRSRTITCSGRGRYIRYTFPKGKARDIAFDATLRAAAPFQRTRAVSGQALRVLKSDFREKVREMRTGTTILFVVDASGSMGAQNRMKAVKGAVLSLLNDAYQKRDKVGMIAFRREHAELLLGVTRSVDLAQRCLKTMPTGGKTPLASRLLKGYELLKAAKAKDPHTVPYMVLVSDGRANVSLNGGNPVKEAEEIAAHIAAEGIRTLVIDTEKDFIKLELAKRLAEVLKADYCRLEELSAGELETVIRGVL